MDREKRSLTSTIVRVGVTMVGLAAIGILGWAGYKFFTSENRSTFDTSEKLAEYTRKVYAPRSMAEFNDAKAEAVELGIMTEAIANQFFRAYGTELNQADLARTCIVRVTHSTAEYQSDGVEKYMANASLYNTPTSTPMHITIIFSVNSDGIIDRYTITVGA